MALKNHYSLRYLYLVQHSSDVKDMREEGVSKVPREAWYVAFLFFTFILLHNADKFLISSLLNPVAFKTSSTIRMLSFL